VLVSHAEQYDSFVLHVTFRMKRREIRTKLLKQVITSESAITQP
jgi:hypothetical protein